MVEQPTGMIGQRLGPTDREPELLTHHEHNGTGPNDRFDDRYDSRVDNDGYDDGYGYDDWHSGEQARFNEFGADDQDDPADAAGDGKGGKNKPPLTPAQRKKRRWRRVRRTLYVLVGLFVVLPALAFTIMYFFVDVPTPEEVAAQQNQVVTFNYADGSEMGKVAPQGGNRQIMKPNEIPDVVKHAVYAAEDSSFETNPGFDIMGILGAVKNQLTGGTGGGSTISQQYIKKATENEDATITRKATELVKAFKMNNEQSKSDIITAYLNTIYFGRGAYGVQTASQAYFGKNVQDIGPSEAALLAGMIQGPGKSENMEYANRRWTYVMDQMVQNNWLAKADRAAAQFPAMISAEDAKPQSMKGPNAQIQKRILAELEAQGYPEEKVQAGGYVIQTTIDPKAQQLAVETVDEVMKGQDGQKVDLKEALVAVDPKTGGIVAYYGGPNTKEDARDGANTPRSPGSSYKPFDLVALLQRGKGLGETYEGMAGKRFGPPGFQTQPINNVDNCDSPKCTVAEGMEKSVNSVFVDMVVNDLKVPAVIDAAQAAGIPEKHGNVPSMVQGDYNVAIGGGQTSVTTEDMAGAYATFAADGMRRQQHFVAKVTKPDGEVVLETPTEAKPAFSDTPEQSKQIAGNVTRSLQPVITHSKLRCANGHECAGKTGTQQADDSKDNNQAWMAGYTPSISVASWVGTYGGPKEVIRDKKTGKSIYGSGLPAQLWQKFMDGYLKGKPNEKFADVKMIGKAPAKEAPPSSSQRPPPSSTPNQSSETSTPETSTPETSTPETSTSETGRPTTGLPGWPIGGNNGGNNGNGGNRGNESGGGAFFSRPPDDN
ncbi:transglycosylase domain-containing protein [Amycolatopsis nigrescens]|uniref:transglycosylase domain-containing protein n=1 Tax=Amycolatopsis nigrescens TaxID=381445 RepID=UPI003CCC2832